MRFYTRRTRPNGGDVEIIDTFGELGVVLPEAVVEFVLDALNRANPTKATTAPRAPRKTRKRVRA